MPALVVNAVAVRVEVIKDKKDRPKHAYFRAYPVLMSDDGTIKESLSLTGYSKKVGVSSDSFKYVKDDKVVSTPLDFVEGHTFVCSTSRKGIAVPKEVEGIFKSMLELFVMDVTKSNRLLKTFESALYKDCEDTVINGLSTVL